MTSTLGKTRPRSLRRGNGKRNGAGEAQAVETQTAPLAAQAAHLDRNPGVPLDLDWVYGARINRSAVERRAATLVTRRTVKKQWQAAWLLRAITCIDLTTLSGDDTPGNVLRLCAKARRPVRQDILEALGAQSLGITVGAVCVYHNLVPVAVRALTLRGPGCVYDLVGVAPPDELAALAPDFERFTQSFALTGGTR